MAKKVKSPIKDLSKYKISDTRIKQLNTDFKKSEEDKNKESTFENLAEIGDPTGMLSYNDVIQSYKDHGLLSKETGMEILGALPLLGPAAKVTQKGIHLAKYQGATAKLAKYLPKSQALSNGIRGLSIAGKASDAYQAGAQIKEDFDLEKYPNGGITNINMKKKPKLPKYPKGGIKPYTKEELDIIGGSALDKIRKGRPHSKYGEIPEYGWGAEHSGALTGAGTGALSGAATGAAFGPWGAAAGAVIGGAAGAFSGNKKDKMETQAEKDQAAMLASEQQVNQSEIQTNQAQMNGFQNPNMMQMQNPYAGNYSSPMTYAMGGSKPCYNCGGMHYANGGMVQYPNGGANAEVEKQEVLQAPTGETMQVNGPSHEQGGVPVNIPSMTHIYSDRLKNPETGKTFAKDAAKYKIIEAKKEGELTPTQKLKNDIRQKKLDQIFQAQEQLKQDKVNRYAQKMGVTLPQPSMDNEALEPQGHSEASEGEYAYGGTNFGREVTMGYQDPRVTGGIDLTNPSSIQDNTEEGMYAKGGRFMGINPAHKGYCTPMSKPTCTGHRRALALTLKKHHGFHANGGTQLPEYPYGDTFIPGMKAPFITTEEQRAVNNQNYGGAPTSLPMITNQNIEDRGDLTMTPTHYNDSETPDVMPNRNGLKDQNNLGKYSDEIGLGANIIGQNAGNIADLAMTRFGKKYDKENFGRINPKYLDPTESLRAADTEASVSRNRLKDLTGGNAGAYLANLAGTQTANTINKAQIRNQFENQNTAIYNQADQTNLSLKNQARMAEQQNKARSEDIARSAIRGAGTNTASAISDYKKGNMDQRSLDIIAKAYPNYAYDKKTGEWKHRTKGTILDPKNPQ